METIEKKPIRIAQIIGRTLNGGVENYVLNYYLALNRNKYQFDFYIEKESLIINKKDIEKYGGRVFIIPSIKKYFSYEKTLSKLFRENKYKIVQANNNSLSAITLRIAKKSGVQIRIANSLSTSNKNEFLRNFIKNILRKMSKKYATHYFACSNLAGEWLFGDNILSNKKYFLVHNAVNTERFIFSDEKRNDLKRKYSLENRIVVGTIGRLEKQKNHLYLIDIFNSLLKKDNRYFLIIIGDGNLYDEIIKKAQNYGIEKNLLVLTSKEVGVRGAAASYYNLFDIFVLPSLYEGLPTVGIEAQINGLPCLFSSTVTRETKVNSNVKFIDLNEYTDDWVNNIIEFSGTRLLNSNDVITNFDINKQAIHLEELYDKFLGGIIL